ncbi:hypothetical protein YB2330_001248 [Saitoella coloradoensis]
MSSQDQFSGFMVDSAEGWNKFRKGSYTVKPFGPYDVDIKVSHCGVCGSDVHTITSGWGAADYPVVPGHEVVGTAIRVGEKVKSIKVGDRVGAGAQIWSCMDCNRCKSDNENYCAKQVDTYNAKYDDGSKTYGGYASHVRGHEQFIFPIPKELESDVVAPMLCGGLTVYSPLVRHGIVEGCKNKKVGIVGIGGLGHFGVMFASALGAEVYAFSHSPSKEADAKKMGAAHFVDTSKDKWEEGIPELDVILSTIDISSHIPLQTLLSLLTVDGFYTNLGLPDQDLPQFNAMDLMSNAAHIGGSHIGSKKECLDMLDLAVRKGVKTWVQKVKVSEEGCGEAVTRLKTNDNVRYRLVLTDFEEAFGKE